MCTKYLSTLQPHLKPLTNLPNMSLDCKRTCTGFTDTGKRKPQANQKMTLCQHSFIITATLCDM